MATLTALSCIGAAVVCAQNSTPISVKADTPNTQLIAPQSYQQYLPLIAPTAVSVTSGCTAIADGKNIYLYEGEILDGTTTGTYRVYTHDNPITQLAFDEDGNLYFLSKLKLYALSAADLQNPIEATKINDIACRNFTIHGQTLYYYATAETVLSRYSLADHTEQEDLPLPTQLRDGTPLTIIDNTLYYMGESADGYAVHAVNLTTSNMGNSDTVAIFSRPLKSLTIANHLLCVVTEDGGFYAYNYKELYTYKDANAVTPITNTTEDETDTNGYVSVHTYNDEVFAIRGNAVRHYSISNAAFTDFEITSASASDHRLNGANDIFLSENKLFIADDGNDRISVYNTDSGVFETAIPTTLSSPYITSYKDTLLAASTEEAVLYSLSPNNYGAELLTLSAEELDGNVIGAACVYDKYYLLTDSDYTYTFTAANNAWSYTEQQKAPMTGMKATAFTADIYGGLYVAYDSGELYRFTEKEFTSLSATGTKILVGLNNAEKISVDYGENLYALSNGVLTKYTKNADAMYEVNTTFTPDYGLVKDDNPTLIAFAFGVKNTDTYFLYDKDYVVKSDELQIPKVSPIPVGNAADCLFDTANRDFAVITVKEDAILTEFDINALQGATEFPYIAFERCYAPFTALKIGEEGDYTIFAVANEGIGYKTYLAKTEFCEALASETYRVPYTETDKTGYLTSAAYLYKFPYLNTLLTVAEMPRGAQVTLLYVIHQLDRTYYEISYTDENGVAQIGFIPTAYVNLFDGTAPNPQTITYGETEDDTDALFRLTYILLGLGAIGILLDVLLLKKPKETDED